MNGFSSLNPLFSSHTTRPARRLTQINLMFIRPNTSTCWTTTTLQMTRNSLFKLAMNRTNNPDFRIRINKVIFNKRIIIFIIMKFFTTNKKLI